MGNKETYDLYGGLHHAPSVATEINDKAFEGSNLRKRGKRLAEVLTRVLGKLREPDNTNISCQSPCISNRIERNLFSHKAELTGSRLSGTLYHEVNLRPLLAP